MEKIFNAIQWVWNLFSQWVNMFRAFFNAVIDFFSSVWSIINTLWYGAKTLFASVLDLVNQILTWELFDHLPGRFHDLSQFIGGPATIFLATLFFVILVRIWIAFVFKILRLNIDYKWK